MISWLVGADVGAQGTLIWTSPEWVVVVCSALALAAWVATWPGKRSNGARGAELALWALALAGMVVALARPVWLEEEGRTEPGRVAVLVDASKSMSVVEEGAPRWTAVEGVLEAISDEVGVEDVDVYHFGHDLQVGPPSEFMLSGTDLEGALDALSERVIGERLASVVVVTDGLDRGLLRRRFLKDDAPAPPALPGPLTVFQVGQKTGLKDLALRFVDAGGYAYVHSPFRVYAELSGVGYEGRTVPVQLLQDDALVSSQTVTIDEEGLGNVEFSLTPDRGGRFTYTVRVPDYDDDAVRSNNVMPVVVRVVRDRIRVMQVAGAPSWDVKFLRRFLKGDPSVDLVSFFILRTHRDRMRRYSNSELSLIQFPYEQLFEEDLSGFDLVIFQNFDYRPYFQGNKAPQLLENLRSFVEDDGHAIVMIGGDRSFSMGSYGTTPLADILPVRIAPQPVEPDEAAFRPSLTEAGHRHPVTRLVADGYENAQWWGRLHEMDGTNVIQGATPDASVLLEHPTRKTMTGEPLPVLAVREVGEGRTMALTVDASWRWSLSEAAEGRGNQAYLRFWKNAMRWLVGDTTTARVTVDTGKENYGIGDIVRIVVRARNADFGPLTDARVTAKVEGGGETTTLEGVTNSDGEIVLPFDAALRGAHRVTAEVRHGGEVVDEVSTVFAVTTRDPELDEVIPDAAFLAWLAQVTDGRYYGPLDSGPILRDPNAGRTVWDRQETPLWRSPMLGLSVLLFAGVAWIIRRRAGLR